jgi:hypothetical protein
MHVRTFGALRMVCILPLKTLTEHGRVSFDRHCTVHVPLDEHCHYSTNDVSGREKGNMLIWKENQYWLQW